MSLFGKTEINPNMIPFIQKGEGVGIVKVDGYGKSSARMESYKLILESYSDKHPIIESISAITYLSYDKGNFFNEPKLEIGIAHKKYILAGVENNDEELEAFYETLLNIKNAEKEQKNTSRHGMIGSNSLNNKSQEEDIVADFDDDILDSRDQKQVDLEKEVINNDSKFSGLTNRIKNVKGNSQEQDDLEIDEVVTKEQSTDAPLTGSDDEIEETLASVEKESNKSRFSRFTSKLKNVKNNLDEEISISDEDGTGDVVESEIDQSVDEVDEIERNLKSVDSKSNKSTLSAFTSKFKNVKKDSEEEKSLSDLDESDDLADSEIEQSLDSANEKTDNEIKESHEDIVKEEKSLDVSEEKTVTDKVQNDGDTLQLIEDDGDEGFEVLGEDEIIEFEKNNDNFVETDEHELIIEEPKAEQSSKQATQVTKSKELVIEDDDELLADELIVEENLGENFSSKYQESIVEESIDELEKPKEEIKDKSAPISELGDEDEIIDEEIDLDRMINDSDEKTEEAEVKVEEKLVEEIAEQESIYEETSSSSVEDAKITQDNANVEIGKMKQQLSQGINNLQAEMDSETSNMSQYIPTHMYLDPIDQIRRYHELKENGIITEEEFELKKKQLLDL